MQERPQTPAIALSKQRGKKVGKQYSLHRKNSAGTQSDVSEHQLRWPASCCHALTPAFEFIIRSEDNDPGNGLTRTHAHKEPFVALCAKMRKDVACWQCVVGVETCTPASLNYDVKSLQKKNRQTDRQKERNAHKKQQQNIYNIYHSKNKIKTTIIQ